MVNGTNAVRAHLLPRHVGELLLEPLTLGLEQLDRFQEQLIRVPLARRLDLEDKVVPLAAQLDLVLKFGMPQHFPADSVFHCVLDHCLHLALVALQLLVLAGISLCDLLQSNHSVGKALLELFCVCAVDGLGDGNKRQQAVRCCRNRRELGVVRANTLVHVRHQRDGLARSKLGKENIGVHGFDGLSARKELFLAADGDKLQVAGVHMRVNKGLFGVLFARRGIGVTLALNVELKLDRVVVHAVGKGLVVWAGLLVPLHPLVDALLAALEGHETQTVAEHLVLDDGCVVVNPHILNGECGDLGDQDTAEGVGDGCVEANEREGGLVLAVVVKGNIEPRAKDVNVPGVVLAWVVAGEVGRGNVCDGFCVDADDLEKCAPKDAEMSETHEKLVSRFG